MARFDWDDVSNRAADDEPLSALLSPVTRNLVIDALQLMLPRWAWGAVSDAEWDVIEAAVSNALVETDMNLMVGAVLWRAGGIRENELLCDGSQYNRVDYPDLYDVLDIAFIVDSDHFTVPDLMDRFILGEGANIVGDTGGNETHTLTVDEMPSHSHDNTPHAHTYYPPTINLDLESPGAPDIQGAGLGPPAQTSADGISIAATGGDEAHNNMPPYLVLTPVIVAF